MINLLLYTIYVLLAVAVGLTAWSALRSMARGRSKAQDWGIPARRIAWSATALLVVVLLASYLLGSTAPLTINGHTFADAFWLRVADMFIITSAVLMAVAIVLAVAGVLRPSQKRRSRHV